MFRKSDLSGENVEGVPTQLNRQGGTNLDHWNNKKRSSL
jgi:hypothetical protein